MTVKDVVSKMRNTFGRLGIPVRVRSYNSPSYKAEQLVAFSKEMNFEHGT
jgi:hypothetical protein